MTQMRNNYQMQYTPQRACSSTAPNPHPKANMYESMNQPQFLNYINEVSFAVADVLLFLDTHPEDCEALAFCNEMISKRDAAVKVYSRRFNPLTIDNTNECAKNRWEWVMQPWPWEMNPKGGCK